jgi:SAM-dependent methyltransferase
MLMIKNKNEFKKENQENWKINSDFWLNNPLRQVEDTKIFFKEKLKEITKSGVTIVDMGCGSGWLLDFILELNIHFFYIGLDFNKKFIEHLSLKYAHISNVSFEYIDFEEELPNKFLHCADIVFNCFNFFETANLDAAFSNGSKMLKPKGKLVIFTIEYTYLILAVSDDMNSFKKNLKIYEEIKSKGEVPYFFQHIDLGDRESENLKYASVLYSFDDFFKQAKRNQMTLADYGEVVKTSKFLPKTYQYIVFNN